MNSKFVSSVVCLYLNVVEHRLVLAWKTPTNRDLLRGFLGAVGYLADDLAEVQIPMAVLHALMGDTVPFRWEYTHQRAFQDMKFIVNRGRESK